MVPQDVFVFLAKKRTEVNLDRKSGRGAGTIYRVVRRIHAALRCAHAHRPRARARSLGDAILISSDPLAAAAAFSSSYGHLLLRSGLQSAALGSRQRHG